MLRIDSISHVYQSAAAIEVLKDFSLEIENGEFIGIIGPNGCGKSTLLKILGGLIPIQKGNISYNEKPLSKHIGYVFQDYRESLFPWLTVEKNIAFPLVVKKLSKDEIKNRVLEIHKHIAPHIPLTAYPYELSGGQQQLVSIMRSLIIKPDIFLLDEPFSSLDYERKIKLMEHLSCIWNEYRPTTFFVSHDIDEAILLSQKIIVLSDKPTRILNTYNNPMPFPRKVEQLSTDTAVQLKKDILDIYVPHIRNQLV